MPQTPVTIAVFRSDTELSQARSALAAAGIACTATPAHPSADGCPRTALQVRLLDSERALRILQLQITDTDTRMP